MSVLNQFSPEDVRSTMGIEDARPSSNNTFPRSFAGFFALRPAGIAATYADERRKWGRGTEEMGTPAYWRARLMKPWLQEPFFMPPSADGDRDGYAARGIPNPHWKPTTQQENQMMVSLLMGHPDYGKAFHLPSDDIRWLCEPPDVYGWATRWGSGPHALDPNRRGVDFRALENEGRRYVYLLIGGDTSIDTIWRAWRATRKRTWLIEPEYATARRNGRPLGAEENSEWPDHGPEEITL